MSNVATSPARSARLTRLPAPVQGVSFREALVTAGQKWTAGAYKLVTSAAALDTSGEWALDGARTCAHWIGDALDVEVCTAREWLRIGHALAHLDILDRAFSAGHLSYSKVRSLTRIATPENQVELCELAERVPAGHLALSLATWLTQHESSEDTERRQHAARGLTWRVEPDRNVSSPTRGCCRVECSSRHNGVTPLPALPYAG